MENAPQPKSTILAVDDEAMNLRLYAGMFTGRKIITAADGLQGIEAYRANRDDIGLILTDVRMPNMDGPTMIERLVAEYGHIAPTIVITGGLDDEQQAKIQSLNKHIIFQLTKPLNFEEARGYVTCILGDLT